MTKLNLKLFDFSTKELLWVTGILVTLGVLIFVNLQDSIRKRRDNQRKSDVREVFNAIEAYHTDFAFYPLSNDKGEILACLDSNEPQLDAFGNVIFSACSWMEDKLADVSDPSYPAYLTKLPGDPHHDQGGRYYYLSNGKYFQIFTALESQAEAEYDPEIEARGLPCGSRICNMGLSARVPLDKTFEEYENEMEKTNNE